MDIYKNTCKIISIKKAIEDGYIEDFPVVGFLGNNKNYYAIVDTEKDEFVRIFNCNSIIFKNNELIINTRIPRMYLINNDKYLIFTNIVKDYNYKLIKTMREV